MAFRINEFELIYKVIQDYFGEENTGLLNKCQNDDSCEVHYDTITEFSQNDGLDSEDETILIYFPTITIKNERGKTHKITDVYAGLSRAGKFYVGRTSFTSTEARHGYSHSHIPILSNYTSFLRSFCAGTGDWANITSALRAVATKAITMTDAELEASTLSFCCLLPLVLSTESLQGGPYFRISNLVSTNAENLVEYASTFSPSISYKSYDHSNGHLYNYDIYHTATHISRIRMYCSWLSLLNYSKYNNVLSPTGSLTNMILKLSAHTLNEINNGVYDDFNIGLGRATLLETLFTRVKLKDDKLYYYDTSETRQTLHRESYSKPLFIFNGEKKYIKINFVEKPNSPKAFYAIAPVYWNQFLCFLYEKTLNYQYEN